MASEVGDIPASASRGSAVQNKTQEKVKSTPSPFQIRFLALPEFQRFVIAGLIGLGFGWVIYQFLYLLNPLDELRATSTWIIAYLIGILGQHALHRWLTFHDSDATYWMSLRRAYLTYSGGLLLSTGVNWISVEWGGLHHQLSWATAMAASLLSNYFLLKFYAFAKK